MQLSRWYTTWFGSGRSPRAPGTMGSLATLPLVYALAYGFPSDGQWSWGPWTCNLLVPLSLVLLILSIPVVQHVIALLGDSDPSEVVIDEVAGQCLTFGLIPLNLLHMDQSPWLLLVGLGLFRFFDISKILGIHSLEKLPGAWGVMADDMLAGLWSALILAGIVHFLN